MLDYLPVGLFGSVMGLTGLSVAWRLAQTRYGTPEWVASVIAAVAVLAFVALLVGYGIKLATAPDAVRTEFRHPIVGNLFGTVLISLLLLPIVVAPLTRLLAQALWIAGAAGMILFAWFIVSRWLSDRQQVAHATPAWIIPVVGLLDVPLALPSLGLPPMHQSKPGSSFGRCVFQPLHYSTSGPPLSPVVGSQGGGPTSRHYCAKLDNRPLLDIVYRGAGLASLHYDTPLNVSKDL